MFRGSLEVTGPVVVKLWASTTGRDTDFIARLIDVSEDGTAYNLTEGIMRARFRQSIWEEPSLLTPGEVYEYSLELLPHQQRVSPRASDWRPRDQQQLPHVRPEPEHRE